MSVDIILATETHLPSVNRMAGEFASQKIFGISDGFEKFCSVTVVRDGHPIAAVILHNFHPEHGTIELSAAASGYWQTRRVVNFIMSVCFDTMQCQTVIMRNAAEDEGTVANSRRLGFTGYLIPNLRGKGKAEWIFTLSEDEWKSGRLYKQA